VANYQVPEVFAAYRATIHIPRRPYLTLLPGIPTIRPFEALSCGIPLISAPWEDREHLFRVGTDFLMARNASQARALLSDVLHDDELARSLIRNGLETITSRHTCKHRVDELLSIYNTLSQRPAQELVEAVQN
jgi:spore maturation protein CgeB